MQFLFHLIIRQFVKELNNVWLFVDMKQTTLNKKKTGEWSGEIWLPFRIVREKFLFWQRTKLENWKHLALVKNNKGKDGFYINGELFMEGKIVGKLVQLK